tara:strand:+ start:1427 stop:1744 length:318 start_codon:yes stop_codon:yes gene_type:complete
MKRIVAILALMSLTAFMNPNKMITCKNDTVVTLGKSFSLLNDTKNKVSIYTGSGFVSLNKGSKTSISCKIGKEVRWAEKGKKGDIIFKIADKHCGKTVKLTDVMD